MKQLLRKEYDSESIMDIWDDVEDAIDDDDIEKDEHGFHKGSFTVTLEWSEG